MIEKNVKCILLFLTLTPFIQCHQMSQRRHIDVWCWNDKLLTSTCSYLKDSATESSHSQFMWLFTPYCVSSLELPTLHLLLLEDGWIHQRSILFYIHHLLHAPLIPPFCSHFITLPPSLCHSACLLCVLTFTFHHLPLCHAVPLCMLNSSSSSSSSSPSTLSLILLLHFFCFFPLTFSSRHYPPFFCHIYCLVSRSFM